MKTAPPLAETRRHEDKRDDVRSERWVLHPGPRRSSLSLSLHPKAAAEPQSGKLGHARSVLTWFFARKGTAEPHFSINTFFAALSPLPSVGRSRGRGPSPRARGLTQKRRDVPTTGTRVPMIIAAGVQEKKPGDVLKVTPITVKVGRVARVRKW